MRVSGSGQSLPLVAWIALLDPAVTTTAQDGLYLVYLFDAAAQRVYLSMNQGVTQHLPGRSRAKARRADELAALVTISADTAALRTALAATLLPISQAGIELGTPAFLGAAYTAGNIAAVRYTLDELPAEPELTGILPSSPTCTGRACRRGISSPPTGRCSPALAPSGCGLPAPPAP